MIFSGPEAPSEASSATRAFSQRMKLAASSWNPRPSSAETLKEASRTQVYR